MKSGKATPHAVRREGDISLLTSRPGPVTAQGSKWTLGEPSVPFLLDMSRRAEESSGAAQVSITIPENLVPSIDHQTRAVEGASSPPHVYAQTVVVGGPPGETSGAGDSNMEQRGVSGHSYVAQGVGGRDTPLEIRDMDKSPVPPTIPT